MIRLWQRDLGEIDGAVLNDLIRFNEAIDQKMTDGARISTEEIEPSRELFLGILGHDLRNPLGAIFGFAGLQLRSKSLKRSGELASQILLSARRMSHILADIMELTRVRLGSGIVITPIPTSIRRVCTNVIGEMRATYPKRVFQLHCAEEFPGEWDEDRLSQLLSNRLGNAVQHGSPHSPITVTAKSDGETVEIAIHNEGIAIPPSLVPKLFESLFQGRPNEDSDDVHANSLGLGLYISREIVLAHGGSIAVQSSNEEGTIFVVRLSA